MSRGVPFTSTRNRGSHVAGRASRHALRVVHGRVVVHTLTETESQAITKLADTVPSVKTPSRSRGRPPPSVMDRVTVATPWLSIAASDRLKTSPGSVMIGLLPGAPGSPSSPWGPSLPGSPVGPVGPGAPGSPTGPRGPSHASARPNRMKSKGERFGMMTRAKSKPEANVDPVQKGDAARSRVTSWFAGCF